MHVVIRSQPGSLRSSTSFALSVTIHGSILLWLALSPQRAAEPRRSLYDEMIKPNERRLVWYNLRQRLPDVAPSAATKVRRPPRALKKFDQTLVAGAADQRTPRQMIFLPAPEIEVPKPLPLPNVVAVAPPPKRVRVFTPPVEKRQPARLTLPEAPEVQAAAAQAKMPVMRRVFTMPAQKRPALAVPLLPDAPGVETAGAQAKMPVMRRVFAMPAQKRPPVAVPLLPDAPGVETAGAQAKMPVIRRGFTAPPEKRQEAADPALPEASGVAPTAVATMAIVGLNPAKAPDFPKPPGSQQAGFSAGPQPRAEGGDAATDGIEVIVVPGLTTRGGAKDGRPTLAIANPDPMSKENLMAAARAPLGAKPHAPPPDPHAARVSSAPDPRLEGRAVYSVAIQMPNVTSYSGSWIVWFAEREPLPGAPPAEVRPPVPLKKVDPKYIADAVRERVEGTVRLFAVIRRDGHVEAVSLVRHLDDRLDRSAAEALTNWVFEPALRNGDPMDVEAVFEIPFRLAPKATR
jgi:TonB family protein